MYVEEKDIKGDKVLIRIYPSYLGFSRDKAFAFARKVKKDIYRIESKLIKSLSQVHKDSISISSRVYNLNSVFMEFLLNGVEYTVGIVSLPYRGSSITKVYLMSNKSYVDEDFTDLETFLRYMSAVEVCNER
jgi:hypothetical protein